MDKFWISLLKLSEIVPMFPHPQDLLSSACKVQRDNDLMVAAVTATKTPFPRSITLTNLSDVESQARNPGVVIKRDYSDSNQCTFLPGKKRQRLVEKKFHETQENYGQIRSLPYPSWIAQPYMPALVDKGEIRAFVVGGKVMYSIHTWQRDPASDYSIELVDNYTPLELVE